MSNNLESQSSSQQQLNTAYYIFRSSQQQLALGDYIVRVEPRNAVATKDALSLSSISQELKESETTELPKKRELIKFDKTVDLMLGIEESSL